MGLLTQLISLSTYLAKLHVSRNQDPKRTAAPKGMASPRGAADKLLGAARHSGQHWRAGGGAARHAGAVREAPGGRLGLSDRKREAGEEGGARRGRPRPQARSTVFLGQWPRHSLLYQAGTAGAGPRAYEGSQANFL